MRLTKQYASALLASTSKEDAAGIYGDLTRMSKILKELPDYVSMVEFRPEEFESIRTLLRGEVRDLVLNFLEVLAEDGMLNRLVTIAEDYRMALVDADLLFDVKVESVRPLSEKTQKELMHLIESHWGPDYVVEFRVDSKLLGGMRLEVNGAVVDTTFRSRIDQIIREVQHGTKR